MTVLLLAAVLALQPAQRTNPLMQGGTVSGRLLNADGTSAAAIRVSAMQAPATGTAEAPVLAVLTETDAAGNFRLENVPPGRYYIMAGLIDTPTYYPGVSALAGATAITIATGATVTGIDFRAERFSIGLAVRGRLIRDTKEPANLTTQVGLSGNEYRNVPIKADGSFEFLRVKPGTYTLSVFAPGFEARRITLVDKDVDLELIIPWTVDVDGRLVVDGGPRPSISLLFAGADANRPTNVSVAQTFRVTLPEGNYGVVATGIPSGFFMKSMVSGSTDLLSEPLRLNRAAPVPQVVITLGVSSPPPWVKVSGRLTGSRPGTGTAITVTLHGSNADRLEAVAGPDGSFEFPMVLPGTYSASLSPTPTLFQPYSITVPNKDLTGIELFTPASKTITGRVTIEDGGPMPRFYLNVSRQAPSTRPLRAGTVTDPTSLSRLLVTVNPGSTGPQALNLQLKADGTFTTSLPEGSLRIEMASPYGPGGPFPYELKTFTYGSTDLLQDIATIAASDSAELHLALAPKTRNSWWKVSGRVTGLATSSLRLPADMVLDSAVFNTPFTTQLNADGSFEFPKVYAGQYTARLSAGFANPGKVRADVRVDNADVTGIEIPLPREKEVSGRIVLQGRGTFPRLTIPFLDSAANTGRSGGDSTSYVNINTQMDGTFKVTLPEGQAGAPTGLPPGYSLKSLTYGATDLIRSPLKLSWTETAELVITLSTPDRPPARVRGKVAGIDAAQLARGPVQVTLSPTTPSPTLQTTVSSDGAFEFAEVFPGTYSARVTGVDIASATNTSIVVGEADVNNVELVIRSRREVAGRILVEGPGPVPRVQLRLTPVTSDGAQFAVQIMSVNPQPDGSFRAMLYEGDYRFASASNLPAGMTLKSAKFGSVDVLREPVRISSRDNPEFQLVVESSGATRRSVSGRVRGIEDPQALAAARVSLQSSSYAITETAVVARDGSFEFPALSPGDYLARVLAPGVSLVSSQPTRIVVSDKDVRDIEITVQGQRTLVGTVSVEGGGSIPRVGLRLMVKTATSSSSSTVTLSPQNDGSFRVNVPEREITVDIPQPPPGYLVKSLTYGKTDLTKTPLNIASADSIEDLHIVLAANNGISYVSVSGRVTGFIGSTRNTRVALTSGPSRIETPLNDDGSFRFPQVYQGNYRLSLVGVLYATPPAPAPITVGAKDVTGVVIAFPRSFLVRGRILMNGEVNKLPEQINLEVRNAQGQVVSRTVANGSFSLTLGEGLHNIAVRDLPEGYTLESLAYDSTDLLKTGLNLDAPPDKEILVRLVKASAAGPSPGGGVRVSGKVTGAPDTIPYPRKLLVSGPGPSDLREVALDNKGNFEFQQARAGTYTLRISGIPPSVVPAKTIEVAGKDLKNVTIDVPLQVEIEGRIVVDGGQPLPATSGMIIEARAGDRASLATPQADGAFTLRLTGGETALTVRGIPSGYSLKSIHYGTKNITQKPMKVAGKPSRDALRITLQTQ